MSQYHIESVDPTQRNSSQSLELELVGMDGRVLDVGCSTGFLGKALAAQGCVVTGVELDPQAASMARAHLDEVVEADLNVTALADLFPGREFDSIVFGDVLEHLSDPEAVLRSATKLLAAGGAIVMSIPNVAHGSLRLALLQGRWDYRETGLLDRTHLRFFTRESVVQMVADAGMHITSLRATVLDPLDCEVQIDDESLPGSIVEWVRHQSDALTYQFVARAEVGWAEWMPVPDLVPAIELPPADDVHSTRAALEALAADQRAELEAECAAREARAAVERAEMNRRILTLRDHAIGAEAAVGTARAETAAAKAEIDAARAEAAAAEAEVEVANGHRHRAMTELAAVKRSQTWRTGKIIMSPVAVMRRILHN